MTLIAYVSRIHFADGVLEQALEAELDRLPLRHPLLVCDLAPAREAVLARALASLPPRTQLRVLRVDPRRIRPDDCILAQETARACDGVIGLGGRHAMHLARIAGRTRAGAGACATDQPHRAAPILIPAGPSACAEMLLAQPDPADPGSGHRGRCPLPGVAICDPTLGLDLGRDQTAAEGLDALAHCVETFLAAAYNPPADAIARDGIHRILGCIERAAASPADLDAQRDLLAGALQGALASQKGLGAAHALAHALAATQPAPPAHSLLVAVVLPVVLQFNAPAASARLDSLQEDLGFAPVADVAEAVIRLRGRLGLPDRLRTLGLRRQDLVAAASRAEADPCNRTNPRHADANAYLALLRAAF